MPTPDITKEALEFVDKMQAKHAKQVLLKILALCKDPLPQDSKALHIGPAGCRRADAGDYRIVYFIEGDFLRVILVGKRNDDEEYKRLARMR